MLTKFKKKYIGNWEFYRRYLLLAIPMILQNAITNLVSFLDNIMVGQLGTEQMSAVRMTDECCLLYLHYFHKSAEKVRKSVHIPGFLRFITASEAREIELDHTVSAAVYHTGYGIIHSQIRTPAL